MIKLAISDDEFDALVTDKNGDLYAEPNSAIISHYKHNFQMIIHFRSSFRNNWVEFDDGTIKNFDSRLEIDD